MAEGVSRSIDLSTIDAIFRLWRLTRAAAWRSKRLGEPVAQSVEHETFNLGVVGSIPTGLTKSFHSVVAASRVALLIVRMPLKISVRPTAHRPRKCLWRSVASIAERNRPQQRLLTELAGHLRDAAPEVEMPTRPFKPV